MQTARTRWLRRLARPLGWTFARLLTRLSVRGREHLRAEGPVIYAANHASTFDALLLFVLLPADTTFVGPGDFRLLWPANWFVRHAGLILTKRGAVDREGLKRMLDVLKAGGRLALFPEGGTWEKPIDDVKPGASYLSQASGARIVPMAFGGTYRVWARIFRLRWPRVTVAVGAPLPPVRAGEDRHQRTAELEMAAVDLMQTIYALLPPDERARYDRLARQRFSAALVFQPNHLSAPDVPLEALAELVAKPNLFSPLVRNARLPVRPLAQGRYVPARRLLRAVDSLRGAFSGGDFGGYLEYRLGEAKAAEIRAALVALSAALHEAEAAGARAAFITRVSEAAAVNDLETERA